MKVLEDKKRKIKIEGNLNKVFNLSKYFYMIVSIVSIYFMIFEASIVIGNYLIDDNLNLADNIFKFSNNISFNRDYRGYFNRAQIKKNIYDKSKDNKYLENAINLLETGKEINLDNAMVIWNLAYLYEELGEDEEALNYWQEVLKRERFYPEVYIKNYDCLMRLYSRIVDTKYEEMINDLEAYYYNSYNKLNKRAKYMNNQLKENYDDIRNGRVDYNIILNGKYEKEVKYFNQGDEKWSSFPYKNKDNPLRETECGVTAMAMIESTIKDLNITPIDMAKYSIENNYCDNDISTEFFDNVINEDKYKLNLQKFTGDEISKVKRLLSDGKHMAIALMREGDFTTEAHYLVLYGIETIDGVNYFNALDSNQNNKNYKDNGNIIWNNPKDGFLKVKTSLFLEQCIQYWIYN